MGQAWAPILHGSVLRETAGRGMVAASRVGDAAAFLTRHGAGARFVARIRAHPVATGVREGRCAVIVTEGHKPNLFSQRRLKKG